MISAQHNTIQKILNLGCGKKKSDNHFGIDINPRSDADLIYDVNKTPWPLEDNQFEEVICASIIEHLENFYGVMEEIWRISKNGALVYISIPHYSDTAAFTDPTHKKYFTTYSFDVLTKDTEWQYYTKARYKIRNFNVKFLRLYKHLFIEALINLSIRIDALRFIRKGWENYFSFIIRAKSIDIVLEVKK